MDGAKLRRRFVNTLLDKVEETRFPSSSMLNRVEGRLATPEEVGEYAEILVKKVENTRFPSTELLDRLDRIAEALPAGENA